MFRISCRDNFRSAISQLNDDLMFAPKFNISRPPCIMRSGALFSLYDTLVGVSGLDGIGVNSADAGSLDIARLLMPLDSLPVLGEARPESVEFLKLCSFSSLRSFMLNAEKCSGSRPINGSANVNAMMILVLSALLPF